MLKEKVETLKKQSVQEVHVSYDAANKLKSAFSNLRFREDEEWLNVREWLGNVVKHSLNDELVNTIRDFKSDYARCALIIRGLYIGICQFSGLNSSNVKMKRRLPILAIGDRQLDVMSLR